MKRALAIGAAALMFLAPAGAQAAKPTLTVPKAKKAALKAQKAIGKAAAETMQQRSHGYNTYYRRSKVIGCDRLTTRIVECEAWSDLVAYADYGLEGDGPEGYYRCTVRHRVSMSPKGRLKTIQPYAPDCVFREPSS